MRVRKDYVCEFFFGAATSFLTVVVVCICICGNAVTHLSDPHARSFLSGAHGPGGGQQRVAARVEAEEAEEERRRKRAADGQTGRQAGGEGNKGAKKVKTRGERKGSSCIRIGARIRIPSISRPIDNLSRSTHSLFSSIALASLPLPRRIDIALLVNSHRPHRGSVKPSQMVHPQTFADRP